MPTIFNIKAYSKWLERCIPCKIGTVPMVVQVSSRKKVKVGKDVLIKEDPGGAWSNVRVNRVDLEEDGKIMYFQADRF